MSETDRSRWERKHRARRGFSSEPRLDSLDWIPPAPGRESFALDLACGRGRHCEPLLRAGYTVVAVDIARAALAYSRGNTGVGDRLLPVQADLDQWPFRDERFDVVLQTNFLDRKLFDAIKRSIKPGGYLLVDTFMSAPTPNADGPSNSDYLLRPHELAREFASWEILHMRTQGPPTARQAMLARRPPSSGEEPSRR